MFFAHEDATDVVTATETAMNTRHSAHAHNGHAPLLDEGEAYRFSLVFSSARETNTAAATQIHRELASLSPALTVHVTHMQLGASEEKEATHFTCVSFFGNFSSPSSHVYEKAQRIFTTYRDNACAFAHFIGPVAHSGPRLIVSDADSTFFTTEAIDLLARKAGSEKHVARITARAMAGELDFAHSLAERVATLHGLSVKDLHAVAQEITPSYGAYDFVQAAHAHHCAFGLVSGGFMELLSPMQSTYGWDYVRANRLDISGIGNDGALTGGTIGAVIDGQAKKEALIEWAEREKITTAHTLAIGDGANDLLMMHTAGASIAYCAKPIVKAQANAVITHPDLRLVAPLLGW